MYSVIIADDDFVICEGIEKILRQNCPQLSIDGIFYDGDELYEYVTKHFVDIIITDYNMPGVSWTQTSEYLKKINADPHIILITAYQDFEYAKTAINQHVDFFMCKPFKSSALIENIEFICGKIAQKAKQDIESSEKLVQNWNTVRKSFRNAYYNISSFDSLTGDFDLLKFHKLSDYEIYEIRFFCTDSNTDLSGFEQTAYDCGEFYSDRQSIFLIEASKNFIVFLSVSLDGIPNKIIKEFEKSMLLNFSVELTHTFKSFKNISSWTNHRRDAVICEHLINIIGDTTLSVAYLQTVTSSYPPEMLFELYKDICQSLSLAGITLKQEKSINENSETPEIKKAILSVPLSVTLTESESMTVNRAVEYSKSHFSDYNFSLYTLADALKISPGHLSKLFKKELSINFSQYLLKLRMEEAKYLLKNTEDSIQIISSKVGYNYPTYFRKVFGNYTGMSPSQYRSMK